MIRDLLMSGIGFLLVAVAAYHLGKRTGIARGESLGRTAAPISLRQEALRSGICPICNGSDVTVVQCGQKG